MPKVNKQVHVHVTRLVNKDAIRHDIRSGRDVIVVPSATLPDNIVMNGIKYPADEIEKSYSTLERSPAPAGHPVLNGMNVSAYDIEASNHYGIGAWNENVRRENGRVYLDKVIDVGIAKQSDRGKEVLNAIEKGDPIHTSTGLTATLHNAEDDTHDFVAKDIVFDHDAILVHEAGAATPDQGVGMLVNSDGEKIEVVNSEWSDDELDWAAEFAHRALASEADAPTMERFTNGIRELWNELFGRRTNSAEQGEADMADNERLEQLAAKVDTIGQSVEALTNSLAETIANAVAEAVKPATEMVANMKQEREDAEAAELSDLSNKLVAAGFIDEEHVGELTLNAARALASKIPTKKGAVTVQHNSTHDDEDELGDYDPNKVVDLANKKEA